MSISFIMVLTVGVLFACGIYLMLARSLTRILLGFLLLGNGANLLIMLTAGPPGKPPLTDGKNFSTAGMSDPLPHALILTAIVITFAVSAFLLALIYRSWRLVRDDSLDDDIEDIRLQLADVTEAEADTDEDYDDTEFGDEAVEPIPGAADLDDDGSPAQRKQRQAGKPAGTSAAENSAPTEAGEESR